eukprot:TRINITY_DN18452_c0_g1_i1.p1 TRINITY_DN18452_c0_g1~~TRINITY_DN18452_c0_g1_i1.p1  ORF type:complete len:1283 (+),score=487.38 TRINITY_DN18452_c0_g1_i1:196-4044(+)
MNNYSLTEEIGRGTNSVVYKGRRKKTIQYVAVKSVDKKSQDKVMNEVSVMHEMDHPNILKFYNWYQTPNHLWLIIEFCAGGDLAKVIAQDTKLPEYTIQMFGRDLLCGLQYLHSQGVINCDLKPSNILIDGCGVLKFCDFGLSRRLSEISPASGEGIRGTPVYMAPELFEEKGAVHSFASDIWSLGCVLYELAAGSAPFHSPTGSISEVINGILEKPYPPLSEASLEFRSLIDRTLKKDAGERITWDELLVHPFWNFRLPRLNMPQQPHFDASVAARRSRLASAAQQRGPLGVSAADVMSKIASENIAKERDTPSYSKSRRSSEYAVLDNADTEVDFAPARPAAAPLPPREDTPGERNIEEFDDDQTLEFVENPTGRRKTPTGAPAGTNGEGPASSTRRFQESEGRRGGSTPTSRTGSPPVVADVSGTRSHRPSASPPTTADKPSSSGGPSKRATSTGARDSTRPPSSPAYGVYKLLFHSSDKTVRPITDNRPIDLAQLQLPPKTPFKALPLLAVLSLSRSELEAFLTSVYKAIAGKTPVAHKLVFLEYFETLCLDPKSANKLINSSLLKLFLSILKQCKSLSLKAKLAHAIGVMVCNATYISASVRDTNVLAILTELLRLQDDAVKRAALACLGEFLFYISTQESQEPNEEWTIPSSTVTLSVRCLAAEDEQLQQYVAQTIDNVSSASSTYGKLFCTLPIATQMLDVFNASKNTMLRVTIASALSRIGRQNVTIIHQIVEKSEPAALLEHVQDGNPRVQQAFLNLVNLCLLDSPPKIQDAIADDKMLLPALKSVLEHQSSVVRAKAVLTITLISRNHPLCFLQCCQNKCLLILDRISRDKEGYVRHCVKAAHEGIQQLVLSITSRITAELTKMDRQRPTPAIIRTLKEHLKLFPIVLQVMVYGSSQMRALIFNQQLITDLSFYLLQIEDLTFIPADDFKAPLLSMMEAIPQNPSLLGGQATHLISHLLKALLSLLQSEAGDVRFLSLKILIDMLSELLSLPTVYSITSEDVSPSTQQLNEMFVQQIFPACKRLLLDDDPMPSWALKLINLLLDRNPSLVTHLQRQELVPIFFRFFQPENANNSLVNVRLIKKVVESPDIDKDLVYRLDIVRKLSAVIKYATARSIDTFLEPALDIVYQLLSNASARSEFIVANEPLLDNITAFVRLLTHPDPQISERSSRCISIIPMMYGANFHELIVSHGNLAYITQAVDKGPPAVQKYVLSALKLITSQSPRLMNYVLRDEALYGAIRHLTMAPRGSKIATLAGQILRSTPGDSVRHSP